MKIVQGKDENMCSVEYTDPETQTQYFWAPSDGGYVRNVTHHSGTLGNQVCSKMLYQGDTLEWRPCDGPLSKLVQKEFKSNRCSVKITNQ